MKTKRNTKRLSRGSLRGLVLLRRYLEDNIRQMEECQKRARGQFKEYWRFGARKMKEHLKTVKAIELEAPGNEKGQR